MSYDARMKNHMLSLLSTGHRHREMGEMAKCGYCGVKFTRAKGEYERLRREHADKFVRKTDDSISIETQNLGQMLEERLRKDKLYREHMRLMQYGTPEEKIREHKREMNGYYERHTGDAISKLFI